MCGIFGVLKETNSSFPKADSEDLFLQLAFLSESRGKEASGSAFLGKQKIDVLKSPLPASKFFKTSSFREYLGSDWQYAIGHARLVTNGSQEDNINNQPVYSASTVAIHNGIIVNDRDIYEGPLSHVTRKNEVDSQAIVDLFDKLVSKAEDIPQFISALGSETKGIISTAIISYPLNLCVLFSNNGSLYYAADEHNKLTAFASEKFILSTALDKQNIGKHDIHQLQPGQHIAFEIEKLDSKSEKSREEKGVFDRSPQPVKENSTATFSSLKAAPDSLLFPLEKLLAQKRCSKCLLTASFPFIQFDANGVCNFCRRYKPLKYKGKEELEKTIIAQAKNKAHPKPLIALSGGRDSCYALHVIKKELGFTPLTYTYDWGMVTDLARRNTSRMCAQLGVEHILISADIHTKRENIRKNVKAWLKRPELGIIPLFMAGDKQFFYYASKVLKENDGDLQVFGMNFLEKTDFKTGFCGVSGESYEGALYRLQVAKQLKMIGFYGKNFLLNPSYINTSIFDTIFAFFSYYLADHNHTLIYNYVPWVEDRIVSTLLEEYDWEVATDTTTTWRIGDGTASFYNYIYMLVAGFTESETFRSNQIREGLISREKGLEIITEENRPRFSSVKWYLDSIGMDFNETIEKINKIPRLWDNDNQA